MGGVLLVSLSAVFTTANLAVAVRSRLALVWAALPWLLAAALAGVSWTDRGESRTVALVQGNVPQELKWLPESRPMILRRYRDLTTQAAGRDIVIWPEAAIPVYLHRAGTYLNSVTEAIDGDLVLGIPVVGASEEAATLHNGAVSTGGGTYLKRRLVPFGEYVPLEGLLRGLIGFFDLPMSRSQPGEARQPVLLAGGVPLAVAICYEVAYPDMVRRDAANAAALVTLSNDTWFGASIGAPPAYADRSNARRRDRPLPAPRHQQWHHRHCRRAWRPRAGTGVAGRQDDERCRGTAAIPSRSA